jgi:hypothetical protein
MKAHPDVNDTLRAEGTDAVRARHDRAKKYYGAGGHAQDSDRKVEPKHATAQSPTRLVFQRASEIEPRNIEWLWPGRLARRKLALIVGEPELGKSQIGTDVIARLTTAELWPDGGSAPSGSAIVLSAEDAAEDTLRPRLEAAGADLDRVHILRAVYTGEKRRTFELADRSRSARPQDRGGRRRSHRDDRSSHELHGH